MSLLRKGDEIQKACVVRGLTKRTIVLRAHRNLRASGKPIGAVQASLAWLPALDALYCAAECGEWRSLVARLLWEQDVAGSNPVSPTNSL